MKTRKVKVGIVGLGSIAQKVYLPFLSKEKNWSLIGAYTPNEIKRMEICNSYRIKAFANLDSLIEECDVIFVHSSTVSHFEIISKVLKKGKDVYVDKPLAANLNEAESLVELSIKNNRKLMVGFNRRFAPMYVNAKENIKNIAWINLEKHRTNGINQVDFDVTILDDYIHLVDTARWLGEVKGSIQGNVKINENNQLIYAHHRYETEKGYEIFIGMHRKAGTNLEQIKFVSEDAIVRVKNIDTMEIEKNGEIVTRISPAWDTVIKRKGFEDCITHFIDSIEGDTEPVVNGTEALITQRIVHEMIKNAK